jgi:hypothetical protein
LSDGAPVVKPVSGATGVSSDPSTTILTDGAPAINPGPVTTGASSRPSTTILTDGAPIINPGEEMTSSSSTTSSRVVNPQGNPTSEADVTSATSRPSTTSSRVVGNPQGIPTSEADGGDDGSSPTDVAGGESNTAIQGSSSSLGSGSTSTNFNGQGSSTATRGSGSTTTDSGNGGETEAQTTTTSNLPSETDSVPCVTDEDCAGLSVGLCALSDAACICLDLLCQPDPQTTTSASNPGQGGETTRASGTGASSTGSTGGQSPTTTTGSGSSPTDGSTTPCSEDSDCILNVDLCVLSGLNICGCVNSVCVPNVDPDVSSTQSQGSATASGTQGTNPSTPTDDNGGTPCTEDDDCLANVALCLDGLLNLCTCVDAVCVQDTTPSGSQAAGSGSTTNPVTPSTTTAGNLATDTSVPCTSNSDCTAALGVSLLGIYVCVDLICELQPTSTTGNGGSAASTTGSNNAPSTTEPIDCSTDQDCVAAIGLGALGIFACIDLLCQQTATLSGSNAGATDPPSLQVGDDVACSSDQDCVAALGVGVLGLVICVDLVCQERTTTTNAASSTTQPPASSTTDIDCSTDQDCVAAIGANVLGLVACVNLLCQPVANPSSGFVTVTSGGSSNPTNNPNTGTPGTPCSDDSDCTVAGETCAADGFCRASTSNTGNGAADSCSDSVDCLLSLNPLCALGLCICLDAVCGPAPDVDTCTVNSECDAEQSCQQGACVDDVSCSTESDCVVNLDLCTLLGICACVNGLCIL